MPRVKFAEALGRRLPNGAIKFQHKLKALHKSSSGQFTLEFENANVELADVVIGCDGVNSTIRHYVVGDDYPASFSHMLMCRGLVPAKEVGEIVGQEAVKGAHSGMGKGDGYVSYPVNENFVNLGYRLDHPEPWPYFPKVTHKIPKDELIERMNTFDAIPKHKALASLFPEEVDIWGVLHMEKELPYYNKGRIAVMGDAAHASTPFLASGAGQGYEDAAVCSELLAAVRDRCKSPEKLYSQLEKALQIYSDIRLPRSQRVVRSSARAGRLLMGNHPFYDAANEFAKHMTETWDADIDNMVNDALQQL